MKIIFVSIGLLLTSSVLGESFQIAGKLLEFHAKEGILSYRCEKSCQALTQVKQHQAADFTKPGQGQFADSLGSTACRVYQGRSLLGKAANGDGRAFCYFDDGSILELNSLTKFLGDRQK
jgi:hypothetical protein